METRFKKQVKGKTMEQIFDKSNVLSVRFYKALNLKSDEEFNENHKYLYEINVRHNEGTDGEKLFENEIKHFEQ